MANAVNGVDYFRMLKMLGFVVSMAIILDDRNWKNEIMPRFCRPHAMSVFKIQKNAFGTFIFSIKSN